MQALKNGIKSLLRWVLPYRLPLLLHTRFRHLPQQVAMTVSQAEALLAALHPDGGETCLCHNNIEPEVDLHIIVPVYNVAPYLKDCLDSIFSQQTRFSFFVTIVDDGSTDGSSVLLDQYVQGLEGTPMFHRTEVVHQANAGVSVARNKALEHIRGRYVAFVDSDDMLLPHAIETLMSAAVEQDADIAEGSAQNISSHGMPWGKVYRANLFRMVHFPPGYRFEDTINIFFLYPIAHRHVQVPGVHYYYRSHAAAFSHSYRANPRAVDSLWVSRRVLSDYFASGHQASKSLSADSQQDSLPTMGHVLTHRNEQAAQAAFTLLAHTAHSHFSSLLGNASVVARLPYLLRHTAKALWVQDYRLFRAAQGAVFR